MTIRLHNLPEVVSLSGCHFITLDHDDAVLLEVMLKRWVNGYFFDWEEAEEPWFTESQPVINKVEAISMRKDLATIDSKLAIRLGKLMAAIRKEYGQTYKELKADGLFKHDYRWINDFGNKLFQRPVWKHLIALEKEEK